MRALLFCVIAVALAACGQPATTSSVPEASPPAAPAAPVVTGTFTPATSFAPLNGVRFTAEGDLLHLRTAAGAGVWSANFTTEESSKTSSSAYRVTLSVNSGALILMSSTDGSAPSHSFDSVNVPAGAETTVVVRLDKEGAGKPVLYIVNGNPAGSSAATISKLEMINQP